MKLLIILILTISICLFGVGDTYAKEAQKPGKSEYRLQSTDVITITVHGHPDLTTKTRVTSDGFISFPLIGKVAAKGLSVQELEGKIKELLEENYLVTAEVLVFIEEYHPRQFSVIGEVRNPGKYDMPGEKNLTLMQGIAMGGGFTKHADVTKTRIMRMEEGKKRTIIVNVKDITDKGEKERDINLEPEDIVFVPESFF